MSGFWIIVLAAIGTFLASFGEARFQAKSAETTVVRVMAAAERLDAAAMASFATAAAGGTSFATANWNGIPINTVQDGAGYTWVYFSRAPNLSATSIATRLLDRTPTVGVAIGGTLWVSPATATRGTWTNTGIALPSGIPNGVPVRFWHA